MKTTRSSFCSVTLAAATVILIVSSGLATAQVVIGDWESGNDGWMDWGAGQALIDVGGPKFTLSPLHATLGSSSLHLTQTGWNQNLSIDLVANGHAQAFFDNDIFMVDITYGGSGGGSYQQIYELALNAPNLGWTPSANPYPDSNFNPSQGDVGFTLVFDYSAYKATIGANPDYIQIILASNTDASPGDFYFDNARLVPVPEPGVATLLVLGGLLTPALRRRLFSR